MRRSLAPLAIAAALVVAACGSRTAPGASASAPSNAGAAAAVPSEYDAMYTGLQQQLDAWDRAIPTATRSGPAPVFGAHVLAANGNRGAELLAPDAMTGVDLSLDALKRLGVGGVTVTIAFPLLTAQQPRSADYLSFYEAVAKHIRDRGLVFSVEQHIAFVGTSFSSVQFDFRSTSFDQFVALDREMTRTILDTIQPDYLTVLSEPDTFAKITGYRQTLTAQGAASMIASIVSGLPRGRTKIGAGASTWLPDAPQYATAFARIGLDYIDMHLYPLNAATVKTTQAVMDAARAAGKPLVLDEAWLYKIAPNESVAPDLEQTTQYFRRDAFSFWSPLDSRFLDLVARLARSNGIAYVAPFWSTLFFGNVAYGASTKDLSYPEMTQRVNQAASAAMRQGATTTTGAAYARTIAR